MMPTLCFLFRRHLALRFLSLLAIILFARSSSASSDSRPSYHITPESEWMNDPQRAFFIGGEWHLYYLYNSNFNFSDPGAGGGTEWYHVTSVNMVNWTGHGVAIEKYQPTQGGIILGDIETGSAVIDTNNTAGFGESAVVAILTQMEDGIQQESLFYSTDDGYTFTPFSGNPVMPNPDPTAKPAFRDPKIIWDGASGQWVIALAEGNKIGFYTSTNLITWVYSSGFIPQNSGVNLGILECPDLFQLDVDEDPTQRTWVLAASANGYLYNRTTGTAYWIGTWDGAAFTAVDVYPQWMDSGPDFYATVSWANSGGDGDNGYASRYAIGWMNNWNYANNLPYYGGWAGQMSLVREIKLATIDGAVTLVSVPISSYDYIFGSNVSVEGTTITTDPATASLPEMAGGAYVIQATVSKNAGDDGDEVRIRVKGDGTFSTTVGYDFVHDQAFLVRDIDGTATQSMDTAPKQEYDAVRTAPVALTQNTVNLTVYVDWNSVEIFVNDGVAALSGLIYPNAGAEIIEVVSGTGQLTLDSFTYAGVSV
ncbi:glycosyl hydrolase [Lipomyces kononenkoae]|uniref:Glycosyl hydrolase n=1 Tax=Lipomyces kononenkoae TaxID=34357 RepID=A0ACC3T5I9_LIPKO